MLGFAYQKGLVPVSAEAIDKAIELNGAAVKMNQAAFLWGRRTAVDPAAVERLIAPEGRTPRRHALVAESLDEMIRRRVEFLTGYQNAAYAQKYAQLVERVRKEEQAQGQGLDRAGRSGRALLLQAAGLQGRVRGRAPVRRSGFHGEGQGAVRRRLQAALPPRAAAARRSATRKAS